MWFSEKHFAFCIWTKPQPDTMAELLSNHWRTAGECFGYYVFIRMYSTLLLSSQGEFSFGLWSLDHCSYSPSCLCFYDTKNGRWKGGSHSQGGELQAIPPHRAPYNCQLSSLLLHWQLPWASALPLSANCVANANSFPQMFQQYSSFALVA